MPRGKLYIFMIMLELSLPVFSQGKAEISFGLAFPELSNIKIKYGNDFQIGAGAGFMPVINFLTITGDMYYNFPKKTEHANPNTWNLNLGGTFINQTGGGDGIFVFYSRLGRNFYFNKGNGIKVDLGLGLLLSQDALSRPLGGSGALNFPESTGLSPVGSIGYFLKF